MAGSLNCVMLIGNLGRDPEIRQTNSGDQVANFPMAMTDTWKDRQTGEKRERTEWARVVVFGGLVKVVEQYLRKGSKVYVSGSMQTRKWTTQDGQDRYTTEVVLQQVGGELILLDGKPQQSSEYTSRDYEQASRGGGAPPSGGDDLDDEIPF